MSTVAGKPGLDPTLPNVPIILGGVERHLCFDYNAIVLVEQQTGVNLLKASVGQPSMTSVRAMLWAALLHENEELTLAEVTALIRPKNIAAIHYALNQAWFGSVADPEEKKEKKPSGEDEAQPAGAD